MNTRLSLYEPSIYKKLSTIDESCHGLLTGEWQVSVPEIPARDIPVSPIPQHSQKTGLASAAGQARLLHDLASIELQAMELGLRTLIEFPDSPYLFKEQLVDVIQDEARHLRLCLEGMEHLGFQWGDWPTTLTLWNSTSETDSLLDRILIVHRYLEGSGLDASDIILRKLTGVNCPQTTKVVKIIAEEEISHVAFGSHWYKEFCKGEGLEPDADFKTRMMQVISKVPKRTQKLARPQRELAGFSGSELDFLESLQNGSALTAQ